MKKPEEYGYIAWPEHKERMSFEGFRVNSGPNISVMPDEDGFPYITICLDPYSPIGQGICRYCIPFHPTPDFHLDNASFHIRETSPGQIRMEIGLTVKRLFSDAETATDLIYGIEMKLEDCDGLRRI